MFKLTPPGFEERVVIPDMSHVKNAFMLSFIKASLAGYRFAKQDGILLSFYYAACFSDAKFIKAFASHFRGYGRFVISEFMGLFETKTAPTVIPADRELFSDDVIDTYFPRS